MNLLRRILPRGLVLATGFLTRLPVPALADFHPDELARASVWFPLVGLVVGAAVAAAAQMLGALDPWLGALAGLVMWVWISGGLHLDGLADSVDALGAAHRDPARFLAVLADPHVGSFGVIALVLQLIAKLVLLHAAIEHSLPWLALALIPAWARWAAAGWSMFLPTLKSGLGERFAWRGARAPWFVGGARAPWFAGGALLAVASAWQPAAALALVPALAWAVWLRRTLGGQTGDLLGAGIEIVEVVALALAVIVLLAVRSAATY